MSHPLPPALETRITLLTQYRTFRNVMREGRLPPEAARCLARTRLGKVLSAAYETVPHYRAVMEDAGYDPRTDFQGPDDLRFLPILTRNEVRDLGTELVQRGSSAAGAFHTEGSSGSSGTPVTMFRDRRERAIQIAKWLRVLAVNGYRMRQKVMTFCHPKRIEPKPRLIQRLGWLRRRGVDYFQPVSRLSDALLDYRPGVLYGNRCHLELVAMDLRDRDLRCDFLELVVATGEVIHPGIRPLLQERLGVDVVESYGSVEMGVMAHETPARDGLHLCTDLVFFEFLDDHDQPVLPGGPGRVVVTDLSRTFMPMIRYDQGDRVVFSEVPGSGGTRERRLVRILGRDDDYALLPDGRRLPYIDFSAPVVHVDGIRQFRIIQERPHFFRVEIVTDAEDFGAIRREINRRYAERFSDSLEFGVYRVSRLEPERSGKIRKFISEMASPYRPQGPRSG